MEHESTYSQDGDLWATINSRISAYSDGRLFLSCTLPGKDASTGLNRIISHYTVTEH